MRPSFREKIYRLIKSRVDSAYSVQDQLGSYSSTLMHNDTVIFGVTS